MSDRHDETRGARAAFHCCRCGTSSCSRTWSCRCSSGARSRSARSKRRWAKGGVARRSSSPRSARPRPTSRSPRTSSPIGTVGTIIQLLRLPDGTVKVLVEGKRRAAIRRFTQTDGFFTVEIEELPEVARAVGGAGRAGARGARDLRDLRQAEQAHRARDPDLGADDRRPRAAGRHDGGAAAAEARRQAGDPGDGLAVEAARRGSTS